MIADLIQHHKLSLLERYIFCTSPIRFKLQSETSKSDTVLRQVGKDSPQQPVPINKSNWLSVMMSKAHSQQDFFFQFVADYVNQGEVPFYMDVTKVKAELKKRDTPKYLQIETFEAIYWSRIPRYFSLRTLCLAQFQVPCGIF